MNKIPFLLKRSSWPNRKIDMTTVTHRSKCYYRDDNQKTSHLNCAFKNESVEILGIGDYRSLGGVGTGHGRFEEQGV